VCGSAIIAYREEREKNKSVAGDASAAIGLRVGPVSLRAPGNGQRAADNDHGTERQHTLKKGQAFAG